jgi:hypothetical protein
MRIGRLGYVCAAAEAAANPKATEAINNQDIRFMISSSFFARCRRLYAVP